ncbi:MAG: hypothetical protein QXI58_01805 [Candidatus Micrarchaeia archaeon]
MYRRTNQRDNFTWSHWEIYGRFVSPEGNVSSEFPIFTDDDNKFNQYSPKVTWEQGVNKYKVVWTEESDKIYGRTVTPTGSVGPVFLVADVSYQQVSPAIATGSTNTLVVWADLRNGTDFDIYGTATILGEEDKPHQDSSSIQYPLPLISYVPSIFTNSIRIKFLNSSPNPLRIYLFDLSGKTVLKKYFPYTGSLEIEEDVGKIKKNIYFLKLFAGGKK